MTRYHLNTESRRAAFTLVELLVVIGIIALLISILLPSLQKARESANRVQCLSNLRQAGLGLRQYTNEYRGFFPPGYIAQNDDLGVYRWIYWPERIGRYISPKDSGAQFGVNFMRCPSRGTEVEYTYGINYDGSGVDRGPWYQTGAPLYFNLGQKINKCKSSWFVLADIWGNIPTYPLRNSGGQILNPLRGWPLNYDYDEDGPFDSNQTYIQYIGPFNGLATIHGNKSPNFLFVDGSASPRTIREWADNSGEMYDP
jgi:prepilin-type N-terminal cleavage/methylation domain-containing protein/prepilin-type processing-associated H-X9-DG protein